MYHDKDILRAYRASRDMCVSCKNTDTELVDERDVDTRSLLSRLRKLFWMKPITVRMAYRSCFCCRGKWSYRVDPSDQQLNTFKEWVKYFRIVL